MAKLYGRNPVGSCLLAHMAALRLLAWGPPRRRRRALPCGPAGASVTADQMSTGREACFTYGTLMFEDIFVAVTGAHRASEAARLDGYACHPVRGELYPGVRPGDGMHVDGRLYRDLPTRVVLRLDDFEGGEYLRKTLKVTTADGERVPAWVYVFRPECYHRLAPGAWDVDRFLATGKPRFMSRHAPSR